MLISQETLILCCLCCHIYPLFQVLQGILPYPSRPHAIPCSTCAAILTQTYDIYVPINGYLLKINHLALSIHMQLYVEFVLGHRLYVYLFFYLFVYLPIYLSIYLLIYLYIYPTNYLSICLFISISIYLSIYLYI